MLLNKFSFRIQISLILKNRHNGPNLGPEASFYEVQYLSKVNAFFQKREVYISKMVLLYCSLDPTISIISIPSIMIHVFFIDYILSPKSQHNRTESTHTTFSIFLFQYSVLTLNRVPPLESMSGAKTISTEIFKMSTIDLSI